MLAFKQGDEHDQQNLRSLSRLPIREIGEYVVNLFSLWKYFKIPQSLIKREKKHLR